jgi:acyl carrier protein
MDLKRKLNTFFKNNFMIDLDNDYKVDDSFLENGLLDSTGVLELVMFLEENYKIKVLDDEIVPENLDSINNIEKYLRSKLT